jgi:hypothetical protein
MAPDASARPLLIDEAVGPHGLKRYAESPRLSVPFATIPEGPLAGVAACGGPFVPHGTPCWDRGRGGYL